MTLKEVKKINFEVYNSKTKELIEKFDKIWPRTFDVDNAFNLYWKNKDINILEIGCFSWREYVYIRNFTKNYTGIDISKEAIEHAKNTFPDWKFIVWDIEEFEFEKKYDIIFAFASLIHSDRETTQRLFEKFHSILTPKWIIYVSLKASEKYSEIEKIDEFWTRIYYHYNMNQYKKNSENKFKIIYEDTQNFNHQEWFTLCFQKI